MHGVVRTTGYLQLPDEMPRCVLLILIMMSRNLVWAMEQPYQSLLVRHKRMEWLMNRVAFVFGLATSGLWNMHERAGRISWQVSIYGTVHFWSTLGCH